MSWPCARHAKELVSVSPVKARTNAADAASGTVSQEFSAAIKRGNAPPAKDGEPSERRLPDVNGHQGLWRSGSAPVFDGRSEVRSLPAPTLAI